MFQFLLDIAQEKWQKKTKHPFSVSSPLMAKCNLVVFLGRLFQGTSIASCIKKPNVNAANTT
jgi:hypothetical protein